MADRQLTAPSYAGVTYELAMREGLALVPLLAGTRRPFERDWQLTPPIREHEDPESAWNHATGTGHTGVIARMSGLLLFEADNPEREEQLRYCIDGLRPVYVERRDAPGKVHVWIREPYVLDQNEPSFFRFDEAAVRMARTGQLRSSISPASDYQPTFTRWDAAKPTPEQYRHAVARIAEFVEATSSGTGSGGGGRHFACYRLGCLLYRFTDDDEAVVGGVQCWQAPTLGLEDGREIRRQIRGSRRTVEREGELALTRQGRPTSRYMRADLQRHLASCLRGTWATDEDLIRAIVREVLRDD